MKTTLKQQMLDNYEQFSYREKKVAKYIVENYSTITSKSNAEIAQGSEVSTATVVRFAKTLGFKGYLEFKNEIKNEKSLVRSPYHYVEKMKENDEVNKIFHYNISLKEDVSKFIENLDYNELDKMIDNILSADTVYLVGIGSDKVVAQYLINYFPLIGIKCIAIIEEGMGLKEKMLALKSKDLVLMSSYPEVQHDEFWLAQYCEEKGAPLALFSNSEIIANEFHASYYFNTSLSFDSFYNSAVLSMIFCDILLLRLYERDRDRAEKGLEHYHRVMSNK
ncbi:MurR/RpiR family transcriptional regulator [Romboutsia sp.]|uniref:MurR/RpiR family transcriptional regulator n=1 Tax=Romboutsia sp. TaxID=1965302 RepID=UPI003F351CCB